MSDTENSNTRKFPAIGKLTALKWEQDKDDRKKVILHLPLQQGGVQTFPLEESLVDPLANLQSVVSFHIKMENGTVEKRYSFNAGGMKGTIKATIFIGTPQKPSQKEDVRQTAVIGKYAVSRKINETRDQWLGKRGWENQPAWYDMKVVPPGKGSPIHELPPEEKTIAGEPGFQKSPAGTGGKPGDRKTAAEIPPGEKISDPGSIPPGKPDTQEFPGKKNCPRCNHEVRIDARYCNRCGYDITPDAAAPPSPRMEKRTCDKCGTHVKKEAKFCNKCGNKLENTCGKCGQPVVLGAQFCPMCGNPLESSSPRDPGKIFCPHCGKEVKLPANFCLNCGKPIKL